MEFVRQASGEYIEVVRRSDTDTMAGPRSIGLMCHPIRTEFLIWKCLTLSGDLAIMRGVDN